MRTGSKHWRPTLRRLIGLSGRLRRDERGAVLVEFSLLAPVMMLLLFGIVQFGMLFSIHSTMLNAARESARAVAVEGASESQGRNLANRRLAAWGSLPFQVDVIRPTPPARDVIVEIAVPMEAAAIVDVLGLFNGREMTVETVMRTE